MAFWKNYVSRCTFDQDSIFLIGSMSIVYGLCKRGGGSSNVHVCSQGGGGGSENVHVGLNCKYFK